MVHVLVTIAAGSALDPPNRPGLAAAVAMMLQDGGAGARTAPEVAAAFEDLGGELKMNVDGDTVQLRLTVLSRNLAPALALLADLVARPRFDAAEWTRAQARRLDEIRRRADEPRDIADDVFQRVVFGDHPYGHPSLGTVDAVSAITDGELRRFHAAHYGPHTIAFVLVGDVELGPARRAVARALGAWQSAARPAALPAPTPLPPRVVLIDRPGAPQSQVRVGHLGRERQTPDFAAVRLLEMLLGGSFTSRLNQNLREKHGYVYHAYANFDLGSVGGSFRTRAGVRTDVTAPALSETVAEFGGMCTPMSPAELDKGRALVLQTVADAFSDGSQAAEYLADLVGHEVPLDAWTNLPASLGALDVPSLAAAARRLLMPDRLSIVVVGDRKLIEPSLRQLPFVTSIEVRDVSGRVIE